MQIKDRVINKNGHSCPRPPGGDRSALASTFSAPISVELIVLDSFDEQNTINNNCCQKKFSLVCSRSPGGFSVPGIGNPEFKEEEQQN